MYSTRCNARKAPNSSTSSPIPSTRSPIFNFVVALSHESHAHSSRRSCAHAARPLKSHFCHACSKPLQCHTRKWPSFDLVRDLLDSKRSPSVLLHEPVSYVQCIKKCYWRVSMNLRSCLVCAKLVPRSFYRLIPLRITCALLFSPSIRSVKFPSSYR